jgi:L-ascorbate metabolism protein UlaG (beta-lactamase superfamily)
VFELFAYRGVKLSWLGHDGFRIQNGKVIYFDPFKIEAGGPKADIILVSHEHFDHCNVEDLAKIITPATIVVAHSQSKALLAKLNVREVKIVKPGDKIHINDIIVEAVPAYNIDKFREPGRVFHPKEDGKVGFIATIEGVRIYHAGDTDHIPEMKNVQTDIALLPVSGTYVMTAQEAAEAAGTIKPQIAVPMHYGAIVGDSADAETFKRLAKCEVKLLEMER